MFSYFIFIRETDKNMIILLLWILVHIFFMISIFLFGIAIYLFIQKIKIISITKSVLSINNILINQKQCINELLKKIEKH